LEDNILTKVKKKLLEINPLSKDSGNSFNKIDDLEIKSEG
jgi:hypothetical protein